jgi:hypothetical protein
VDRDRELPTYVVRCVIAIFGVSLCGFVVVAIVGGPLYSLVLIGVGVLVSAWTLIRIRRGRFP